MKQPGDVLASAMEYMPGKGVYEDNGELIEWGLRFQPVEKDINDQYLEYSSSPGKLINQDNII